MTMGNPGLPEKAATLAGRASGWWRAGWSGTFLDIFVGLLVATFLVSVTPGSQVFQVAVRPLDGLGYGLLALTGLALAVRRRWPSATFSVGAGAAIAYLALLYPGWPIYVGAGLVLVAFLSSTGRAGWPLAAAGGIALALASGRPEGWQPARMLTVLTAWLAITLFTAQATELRRRRAEEHARHRVVEERLRIAREMHDVLSHSLATISLQSGTGLRLFPTRPEQAEAALRSIRQVSNDALAQARATLATIRDPVATDDRSVSGLDDLQALFASVRAAGLVVEPSVDLGGPPLPAAVGSAVYRVVQESLTNVMRHAGAGARAAVEVARRPGGVLVEVTDTGSGATTAPATTPGHGLIGMRERVLGLGGEFSAGPQPPGGFRVRVWLPVEDAQP